MASQAQNNGHAAHPDTLITIKVSVNDSLKKLKLPLRDLGADVLPDKLRTLLNIKPEQTVVFERFSDSAGGYITLDSDNVQVFKTLLRAAKAKLKLRLKATVSPLPEPEQGALPRGQEEKQLQSAMDPVIVRSPNYQNALRDSTALDRRSVGSGIFQFREARASQQTLVDTSEAPVPRPFGGNSSGEVKDFFTKAADLPLAFRTREPAATFNKNGHAWSVYCNVCDVAMNNAHFHCSICDGGDYDLCERCVASGKLCPGEGHWLIKRFIQEGKVINSTTERISPRKSKPEHDMPGAFAEEAKTLGTDHAGLLTRTCNSCVAVYPEREFVHCMTCDDFDLCTRCFTNNKHGHHPAHGFEPASEATVLSAAAQVMLAPGRNMAYNAICDGCDKRIHGIRHKCLSCPDWDLCDECMKNARHTHPRHRFAAIYEPLPASQTNSSRHIGIYCDGPLCSGKPNQSFIVGVRYKCAVCHDTDFCASCEALPTHRHNRTHPFIKFKTPVRNVQISTQNEDTDGTVRNLGDRQTQASQSETRNVSTGTTPVLRANAATQVQTVAEIAPSSQSSDLKSAVGSKETTPVENSGPRGAASAAMLNAHFVSDSIPDGLIVRPGTRLTQIWKMRNPGPFAWPAGCSVRFVGGDNMLNVNNQRPAAVSDIANASESNVVGRDVQAGEEVAFKVMVRAPLREGKHISYWRLKAPDGTPFGHRLWCDLSVEKAPQSTSPSDVELQQMIRERNAQNLPSIPVGQAVVPGTQPPAYDTSFISNANVSARIAAMREQQAKRREHMISQFHAHREQLQAQGINRQDMPNWGKHFNPVIGGFAESSAEDDKARKEAARQRVEHIKAKILRARGEKIEANAQARALAEARLRTAAAETEKSQAEEKRFMETEKVKKIMQEVANDNETTKSADQEDLEGSQMVFPKLEKESPASSTYQSAASLSSKGKAAYVENEHGEIEQSADPVVAPAASEALTSPATEATFDGIDDDDLEVLSAVGEDSDDDDGFLTDEEYDILDASDQETVASK